MEGSRPASSALGRNVDETVGPANEYLCGPSGKPSQDFLDHRAVDPSRKVRCAERFLARNRQRQDERRIADFDGMKLF